MAVTLLFFARVREAVGHGSEVRELPETVTTPVALASWLAGQGAGYAEAFADPSRLRCAVDQVMVAMDAPLGQPKEIAFFPPVTGG
jgi:sulfur-carrier protein